MKFTLFFRKFQKIKKKNLKKDIYLFLPLRILLYFSKISINKAKQIKTTKKHSYVCKKVKKVDFFGKNQKIFFQKKSPKSKKNEKHLLL